METKQLSFIYTNAFYYSHNMRSINSVGRQKKLIVRVNVVSRNVKTVVVEICKQKRLIDVQKRG
jgi:hypothetical protein